MGFTVEVELAELAAIGRARELPVMVDLGSGTEVRSAVGGGALPLDEPPSFAVAVEAPGLDAEALDARLRAADPPLVGHITEGRLVADVRTLADDDLDAAARVFASAAARGEDD